MRRELPNSSQRQFKRYTGAGKRSDSESENFIQRTWFKMGGKKQKQQRDNKNKREESDHDDEDDEASSIDEVGKRGRYSETNGTKGHVLEDRKGPGNKENGQSKRKNGSEMNINLGLLTNAANGTVQVLSEARDKIQELMGLYKTHVHDVEEFAKNQERFAQLEEACQDKEDEIGTFKATIKVLKGMGQDQENELEQEKQAAIKIREELEEQKESLKRKQENAEKRIKATEAEHQLAHAKELEKLKTEQEF